MVNTTVTPPEMLDVHVDCDEGCFELPAWRDLLTRDPRRHVFSTPEWQRLWWEEFGEAKDLFLITMTRDDEVVALVPLYRKDEEGRKVLRFLGGIDLTDYLGPICSAEDRRIVAETLCAWLLGTDVGWDEFDAHNMPVPFGFAEFLVERADAAGLGLALEQEDTSAVLPLPGTWDEYLASLDSKERHELKRKRRRLAREQPDASFRTATPDTFEADLETFIDMHRGAEGLKGHFMRPEIATFFRRVARSFMTLGWLRLDFLEIGGTAVAAAFGFEVEKVLYLYNSAFDPDARRLSPGLVLVSEQVRGSIERGLRTFDFLRGPERYKYQLGAQPVPLNNVRLFPKAAS
jgi:CelD/BcsL family acetyltransferase involved in cellulose biosynthesis